MILTIASYFGVDSKLLNGITEYLLQMRMDDGGWNCAYYQGASKSSLHTTISVLEGLWMYLHKGGNYPKKDVEDAIKGGVDFILKHSLFKSVTTGEVIKDEFFRFCFPVRWKYDIMRCLDLFSRYRVPYDSRMDEALTYIVKAKNKNGVWKAYVQPGKTYFELEKQGTESRWNTLRALRILAFYNAFDEHKY